MPQTPRPANAQSHPDAELNTAFDVRRFGAVGDGTAKDTHALQRAIDACHHAGGGCVVVPPGRYLTGTLYLKSHVHLHLQFGAMLHGSTERADYNPDDVFPENHMIPHENTTGAHLIIAYRQHDLAITGPGTIDGHSAGFFDMQPDPPLPNHYRYKTGSFRLRNWRPAQMVYFCLCRNITVRDVKLVNAPQWTLFMHGCDDVQIRGLRITNPPATPNGDGIDIDCCRRVNVSDCIIRSGDDALTLRGGTKRLGKYAQPCEDITVTNCVLSTPCCAVRVGVGDGEIRRCTLSNIVVTEARTAVNMVCRWNTRQDHGARIEQVHFTDFVLDVCMPLVLIAGPSAIDPAYMRDVSFTRFRGDVSSGSQLVGSAEVPLQRIKLSDFDLHVRGGTDNTDFHAGIPEDILKVGYHGKAGHPALPCVFYGRYLEDSTFEDIRIRWSEPSPVWREGFFLDRVEQVKLDGLALRQPTDHAEGAAVRCRSSSRIHMAGCYAERGSLTFMRMESSPSDAQLRCMGNDFAEAEQPIVADVPIREI